MKSLLFIAALFGLPLAHLMAADERPNVLLILVDDLKPALGCYGDEHAKTPHIDALAARGMRFDLAYCNQAVCAPSRFTLMLGSHSTSTGLYGLGSILRKTIPDAVTIPQHFAKHGGYRTESLGKIFHIGHGNLGDPDSFSVPHFKEKVIEYLDPASKPGGKLTREEAMFQNKPAPPGGMNKLARGAAFESPEVADDAYADGRVAVETVRRLEAAKKRRADADTPFFIAAGFARPHLPFSAPKKYWDLYDPAELPLASNTKLPASSPAVAHKRGGETRNYFPVPDKNDPKPIDDTVARQLVHGYYASVSYVDAQIGKVISGLDRLGLADNTIVVLWGDHGFHLGDLGIWTKHTNYEQANRIPILISAPGVTKPGTSTKQPTESVDIYPTLAELAGLPAPTGPQPIDGVSLVPVLRDGKQRVRDHAFHAYPKKKLGRAIRTERYRLVEWGDEHELYDYQEDPHETKNHASEKPEVVSTLKGILASHPAPKGRGRKSAKRPPNIISVFIDDMGYSDFSCFGGTVKTQHVDRLAAEGIKFTQFYVNSPICSPSRVALTTGQYPQRYRITSYLNNRKNNIERGMAQWLDPKAPTLPRQLKKHGYATGHFGKWHMGGQRDVADAPAIRDYGFDQSLTNFEGMGPKLLPLTEKPNPKGDDPIIGKIWGDAERLGEGFRWMQRSEITTGFVDAGLAFIDKAQADDKPFYINLWPDDVHGPFWPPLDKWGGNKRALYQGVLDSMDEQLARLFDRVRNDPKLRNNTIITICSDNGHEPGAGTSKPFRGAKTWMYEGGIRSPLIVWAPGLMPADKAGTTNGQSAFSAIDLNRSLYQIAGTRPVQKLDGEDVSATLLGKSQQGRSAPICWRRPPDRPGFSHGFDEDNPDLAIREGRWKLMVNYDGSTPQLYDLSKDPSETKNLAAQHPEQVERLHEAVKTWNAGMPADKPYTKPIGRKRPAKK